jgi:hypothetical protein
MCTEDLRRKLGWALVLAFLLLASAEFLLRGPIRFARASTFNDFTSPYAQTRAWMKGVDPYSPANLVALWPRDAEQLSFLKKDLADGSLVLKRAYPQRILRHRLCCSPRLPGCHGLWLTTCGWPSVSWLLD